MSLLNNNKNKGKKKGDQPRAAPGFPVSKGKSQNKSAAKQTRLTGRSQKGS